MDNSVLGREHLIDCNPLNPWTKDGFTIEEHQKGGQWKFDPKQVEFFLASGQKDGKVIEGNKLRKELAEKSVMNANVLDYLLAHPELIPDGWKTDGNGNTRYIFFWGTVYRDRGGDLCVRCLDWPRRRVGLEQPLARPRLERLQPCGGACRLSFAVFIFCFAPASSETRGFVMHRA